MKQIAIGVLALALGLPVSSPAAPAAEKSAPRDPIEGKWWGKVGFPQDRIDIGFEFKRNEKGELKAYLYEPVGNFYGLEIPGTVVPGKDTYTAASYALTLRFRGEHLEGTYYSLKVPIELHRSDLLPSEQVLPELPTGPGLKWTAKLGAAIYAPAAVRDGIAYVGTSGGTMNAVRISDGSFVWMFSAGRGIYGEALTTDDHIYFACDSGYLYKLDRLTGKEIWRYDLGDFRAPRTLQHQVLPEIGFGEFDFDAYAPRPVLDRGVIYIGSGDGSFHAVDAESGSRVWRFENSSSVKPEGTPWNTVALSKNRTTAVIDSDRVIYGSFDQHLYALDRTTGKELWNKMTYGEVTSTPLLLDGKLVIGNRGGLVAAVNPADGKTLWRTAIWGSAVDSSPIPAGDGMFLIGSSDMGRISLMDSKDGRVIWRAPIFGLAWATPSATEQVVYAAAAGFDPYAEMRHVGGFLALDRKTGAALWRWPSPPCERALMSGFLAGPVVAEGFVIVGGLDGNLYAFPAA